MSCKVMFGWWLKLKFRNRQYLYGRFIEIDECMIG